MTKKDFELIVKIIKDGALINCATQSELAMNTATRGKIAQQFADNLIKSNPRFDKARFLSACGVKS